MDRRNCESNILQFKHILKQNLEDFELFDSQVLELFYLQTPIIMPAKYVICSIRLKIGVKTNSGIVLFFSTRGTAKINEVEMYPIKMYGRYLM